jgi:hypothetical protein
MNETLITAWLEVKAAEQRATAQRREIEDQLTAMMELPENLDGTKTIEGSGYQLKITGRLSRKIDSEKLQELASEHGLSDHLGALFRWKPEINMAAWKAADESITRPLLGAITTSAARPSFAITIKE